MLSSVVIRRRKAFRLPPRGISVHTADPAPVQPPSHRRARPSLPWVSSARAPDQSCQPSSTVEITGALSATFRRMHPALYGITIVETGLASGLAHSGIFSFDIQGISLSALTVAPIHNRGFVFAYLHMHIFTYSHIYTVVGWHPHNTSPFLKPLKRPRFWYHQRGSNTQIAILSGVQKVCQHSGQHQEYAVLCPELLDLLKIGGV